MKVLIFHKDTYFLTAISDYLPQRFPELIVDTVSTREKAVEILKDGESYQVVIADEDLLPFAPKSATKIVSGIRTFIPEDAEQKIYLNIYQRKDDIVSDLKRILARKSVSGPSFLLNNISSTKIISVMSPQGGSGKTTAAYFLASAVAKSGKNSVFLSLEPFACLDKLCDDAKKTGFGEILYKLRDNRDIQSVLLENLYKNSHGIYMLPLPDNIEDLLSVTKDEFGRMIDALSKLPDIDYVIIDIGFPPSEELVEILKNSHVIVITVNDSSTGRKKLECLNSDPFIGLGSLPANKIVLWNKCGTKHPVKENEVMFPYSDSISEGYPAVKLLSSKDAIAESCFTILNAT